MAETFLEGAREVVQDQFCNALSVADGALDFLGNVERGMGTRVIENPPLPADINGLIGVFCNRPPDPLPPPTEGPEYTGGQCPFRYTVNYTIERESGPLTSSFQHPLGPTGLMEIVDIGGGFANLVLQHSDPAQTYQVGIDNRNGAANKYISHRITSVAPKEATDIDNCGDYSPGGTPTPPPGTDVPINDDIVVGPPGSEVNIPVAVGFGDVNVDVNGSLNVGFNIVNPEFNLTGNLSLTTGDINFNLGGSNPSNEECCLPPRIDDDDTDETGEDDDDETRSAIVGVLVNCVVDEPNFKGHIVNQDNGPTLYHPRLANLYFRLRVDGQIFWTDALKVKNTNQYIQCPADFGASLVVADPVDGVTLRLSPIRRRIPVSEFP